MTREPLIHITKRSFTYDRKGRATNAALNVFVRLAGLVLALLACALILLLLTGLNPLKVYESIWSGAMGTSRRIWETIRNTAILLCIGFAISPAYRMRFWNTGAEGQVLIGACATAAVMIYGGKFNWPSWMVYALSPLAGMAAGMIWGVIPAFFKAHWNTNETLFTLMLNYIATQIISLCIVYWENPKGSNSVGLINSSTKLGWLPSINLNADGAISWLPQIKNNSSLFVILIVAVLMILVFIYMNYTKQGYEIAVVGESENTAHYAGIEVKRVVIRTMAICGAIGGLAGYLLTAGVGHTISTGLAGGRGFTAIVVAWLGKLNPFFMLLISFLLVFMERGSGQIATDFGLNSAASEILTGVILFFILGCEFFINYQVHFRRHHQQEGIKA